MRRKNRERDVAYMLWVKTQPCCVPACVFTGDVVEAHHSGIRGLCQKAADSTCIPLCQQHHTEGSAAVHRIGKNFWEYHGIDRDAEIARLNAEYSQLTEVKW